MQQLLLRKPVHHYNEDYPAVLITCTTHTDTQGLLSMWAHSVWGHPPDVRLGLVSQKLLDRESDEPQAGSSTEMWKSAPCQTEAELMTEIVDLNVQLKVLLSRATGTVHMTNHHMTNCYFVVAYWLKIRSDNTKLIVK